MFRGYIPSCRARKFLLGQGHWLKHGKFVGWGRKSLQTEIGGRGQYSKGLWPFRSRLLEFSALNEWALKSITCGGRLKWGRFLTRVIDGLSTLSGSRDIPKPCIRGTAWKLYFLFPISSMSAHSSRVDHLKSKRTVHHFTRLKIAKVQSRVDWRPVTAQAHGTIAYDRIIWRAGWELSSCRSSFMIWGFHQTCRS